MKNVLMCAALLLFTFSSFTQETKTQKQNPKTQKPGVNPQKQNVSTQKPGVNPQKQNVSAKKPAVKQPAINQEEHPGEIDPKIIEELGFTNEQKVKLEELNKEYNEKINALKKKEEKIPISVADISDGTEQTQIADVNVIPTVSEFVSESDETKKQRMVNQKEKPEEAKKKALDGKKNELLAEKEQAFIQILTEKQLLKYKELAGKKNKENKPASKAAKQ